jgi:glycine cleavage system regulatory protein
MMFGHNINMQIPLVMTIIGPDRPGLVDLVAGIVAEHGGNWLESRMCRLGGEFAGILRALVPAERRAALETALQQLPDLTVVVRADESAAPGDLPRLAALEVVGHDRPGIVREVTRALAALGVSVEELATECLSAPMSGEPLFQARARLLLPAAGTIHELRQSLEQAVPGMTVEISRLD